MRDAFLLQNSFPNDNELNLSWIETHIFKLGHVYSIDAYLP